MASASGGPSGKRSYDMELNLVPFIDLLSCCIAFLMVVAVWTQTARIEAAQKSNRQQPQTAQDAAASQPFFNIEINPSGYVIRDSSGMALAVPKLGAVYDEQALQVKIMAIRSQYPKLLQMHVSGADGVAYKYFIQVMDKCLAHGFTVLSVGGME